MKSILKLGGLVAFLTGSLTAWYEHQVVLLSFLKYGSYQEVLPGFYLHDSIDDAQQENFLQIKQAAEHRVLKHFDTLMSDAVIFVSNDPWLLDIGFNPAGMSRSSPFTQYIFIGPKGQNVDVMAHELMHAEMAVRVGYLADRHRLPIWFKEGFALQVDKRSPFVEQLNVTQQEIDAVRQLYTISQFQNAPSVKLRNYQLSQLAVAQLNLDNLDEKLLAIKQGKSFESVFVRNSY
ncbi:hypothetical protein [Pseudoalteromonas sp. OOF1S-7]|uniref:hypothetical protein n=1 Tax=Pseudoalteromonas sp. OOF1S-7 TaxID=2917757 RepID=UPI001EF598E3|nr:hypothetical protein [Pseudoalteromonas sp. OOF1S-7]MCG7534481.1 hypothetical protein [Pseudoalteromonas sp. OOF1S-7]